MNSKIFSMLGLDPAYYTIALLVFCIILITLQIMTRVKLKKLERKYTSFLRGKDAETLEDVILKRFNDIDILIEQDKEKEKHIRQIYENLQITYQKVGIVKYDAFKEMGGKLSFSLALLDQNNSGFVMNAMHSREGCYTYIKEIIKGESFIVLGEEEKQAVDQAIRSNNA